VNIFECRHLSKAFRRKPVLRDLSLTLPPGMVVGLLGKNGAGKTTFIKCALGLIKPDAGDLRIFGEDVWSLSPGAKERLGYVPQEINLYPWMKVKHVVPYIASFYQNWNPSLADDLMKRWELPPGDRVGTLSTGQLQKLAILVALGHEPEFLVLDEPAAALDPVARRDFLATLLEIAADARRTILFSTHITSDLERVADHVAILKEGTLAYFGPLDELKDQVKRLHITATRPFPAGVVFPNCLDHQIVGNEARLTISTVTPEVIEALEREYGATIEVEDLNLDDIFLELHHA